jgi:uncharacterized protein (DUF2236 family)
METAAIGAERDEGLFGPRSMAWRVIGHPVALVGGLRSLLIQTLHPLAMAGVANHSDYRGRPLARLRRTAHYVAATTFGTTAQAHAAAAHVRKIHARVRGVDTVTGKPYSAEDPETQLWVHNVEWHSFLAAYRAYGGARLTRGENDQYLAEGARVAALLGVPPERVPATVDDLRAYFARVRTELCVTEAARAAIEFVINPPVHLDGTLPYQIPMRIAARAAVAIVPRYLRRLAGIPDPGPMEFVTAAAVRSASIALRLPVLREAPAWVVGRETHELGARAIAATRAVQRLRKRGTSAARTS